MTQYIRTATYDAQDQGGKTYQIYRLTEVSPARNGTDPSGTAEQRSVYITSDDQYLRRISETEFEIAATGARLYL